MKLYLDSRKLVVWAFIAMVSFSSITLILETNDYLLMYASINQLQLGLSSMSLQSNGPGEPIIMAQVWVDNPVNYGGLEVILVDVSTNFFSGNSSLFQKTPLVGFLSRQVLAADKTTIWNVVIHLNPQNATSLNSFYRSHDETITANATLTADVTTSFLNQVTMNPAFYQVEQNMTLT